MRVTSNSYTNLVVDSSQFAQQQLAILQQQIASGNTVQFASDNPLAYSQAAQTQVSMAQTDAYTKAATTATNLTSQNNSAMTSLYTLVSNASDLATGITTNMSASDMKNVATQLSSVLTQITSIANRTSGGNYLFGGTSNQPPIDATGNYNTATNGQSTSIDVQPGNTVQTGIVAGRPGTPPVDGFLYDSTSGTDVIASIKQTITDLNAGNATAVQSTDSPGLNKALDHISSFVGSTAASMSAVSTATQSLAQQATSMTNQLNALTQTNLPTVSVQLQQIENQYQASLQAGTRLMNLSILNYMSSVPNS